MFQILVLTHGRLGEVLLDSARTIAGETPNVSALSLDWQDTFEEARAKVASRLAELENGEGVLVLTDMYGGTPFNVARSLLETARLEIVTGVNLPMVLRLACLTDAERDLRQAADWIRGKGQGSISLCTTESEPRERDDGCD